MPDRGATANQFAGWVTLGAAVLFMGLGILALRDSETAILRLATLGVPGWPVYVAAGVEIVAGGLLLHRPARTGAALMLAALMLAGSILSLAYREPESALEGLGLVALAVVVWLFERLRR
jgi:hypothetical protein